jgi:molybdate transport system substrate-binding protein
MIWKPFRPLGLAAAALAALIELGAQAAIAQSKDVVVYAPASLKNALDDVKVLWQRESGKRVTISYAASSALAKQIEAGAPADIFVSADLDWMDYLAEKGLIRRDTRADLLGNRLVLIAPKDSALTLDAKPDLDLAAALGAGRLALANVEAVPAGKYGKAVLQKLGAWESVKNHLAQSENVRAALLLVARGECPLGIVYATDAAADPSVKVVGTFPADTHPAIVYPIAVTRDSAHLDSLGFLGYLRSDAAKRVFETQGFTVLNRRAGS